MKFKQILIPVSFTLSIALALAACADNNGVGKATATTPEKSSKTGKHRFIGIQLVLDIADRDPNIFLEAHFSTPDFRRHQHVCGKSDNTKPRSHKEK